VYEFPSTYAAVALCFKEINRASPKIAVTSSGILSQNLDTARRSSASDIETATTVGLLLTALGGNDRRTQVLSIVDHLLITLSAQLCV